MSLTIRVLIGLVAGLVVGFVINASPDLRAALPWIEPVGSIFINAIRMTVVPLVVASLVVGVAGAPDARAIGRVGWRALALFVVIVLVGAVFGAIIAQPILARMIDPASTAAVRAGASELASAAEEGAQRLPTFAQWLIDLVPSNPIRAAADGAMLPLIVFSLLLASRFCVSISSAGVPSFRSSRVSPRRCSCSCAGSSSSRRLVCLLWPCRWRRAWDSLRRVP